MYLHTSMHISRKYTFLVYYNRMKDVNIEKITDYSNNLNFLKVLLFT